MNNVFFLSKYFGFRGDCFGVCCWLLTNDNDDDSRSQSSLSRKYCWIALIPCLTISNGGWSNGFPSRLSADKPLTWPRIN